MHLLLPCICSLPLKPVATLALLPFKGRTEVGMSEAARALPGEGRDAVTVGKAVNVVNVVNAVNVVTAVRASGTRVPLIS